MPVRTRPSTTRLPKSLQAKIKNEDNDDPRRHTKTHKPKISRKESRKQQRLGRKQRKAEFFSATPTNMKRYAEEHTESPQRKRARVSFAATEFEPGPIRLQAISNDNITAITEPRSSMKPQKAKSKTALEKLAIRAAPSVAHILPHSQREREEDAYITYLETKLGYTKGDGKKNKRIMADDGLDDLLDLASSVVTSHRQARNDSLSSDGDKESVVSKNEEYSTSEEEWHGIEEPSASEESSYQEPIIDAFTPSEKPIAGTPYVPPQMRNRAEKDPEIESEALTKLKKQLKGLLNRMSEQNMGTILDSIEEVYRKYRRNDVTSTLTTLIIDGISSHSSLLDSYVVLYAAFVSSLHKMIGVEFAAYFVQNVVSSYEQYYAALQELPAHDSLHDETQTRGKECSNLMVLISELYNFQVISCLLVFDIIRGLLVTKLSEFGVELLLKVVRNSGQQLRQDDPLALKDIIQIVQNKVSDQDDALNSRTRFMVETLTNLKNNKLKRNLTQNQGADALERMKKFLSGLGKKRHVIASEPLRISLEDLHSAESKGKWWLVGAAWGGDPLLDRQEGIRPAEQAENDNNILLKLARKQGMNTDIRRSIFVVLMSSDDYADACERLSQLNLTEVQQREIVRVILICCGNEKTYNPYYTLVCQYLCRTSHSYKITLQFCLWDFLRDLGETSVGGEEVIKNLQDDDGFNVKTVSSVRLKNVARAYAWWIAKDCVTLAILKPVDFTILKPRTKVFLKVLFSQLFVDSQVTTPLLGSNAEGLPTTRNRHAVEEIFIKATRIENLAMGLVYFLSGVFKNDSDSGDLSTLMKWGSSLAKDTLRTGMDIIPVL